jgi:PPOX class probable F420-dependent enzyme
MDIDEARAFLRENHRSVLVARKPDGDPQPSPVVHGVFDDGRLAISSREAAYKVRNLRRDPRVTLCAFPDSFFGRWVVVEGRATIISLPDALDQLIELYRRVAGEHPDWDEYKGAMEAERRVIISIDIERAGPDVAG